MPRRVELPGASELFRATHATNDHHAPDAADAVDALGSSLVPATAPSSGRVRHEDKITVYVSEQELLALHGVGPIAVTRLSEALAEGGRSLRQP